MTVNPKEELKSCPFCGCKAKFVLEKPFQSPIQCTQPACGATMPNFGSNKSTVIAWNARSTPKKEINI